MYADDPTRTKEHPIILSSSVLSTDEWKHCSSDDLFATIIMKVESSQGRSLGSCPSGDGLTNLFPRPDNVPFGCDSYGLFILCNLMLRSSEYPLCLLAVTPDCHGW